MPRLSNPSKRQMRDILDRKQSAHTRSYGICEYHQRNCEALQNSHNIGRTNIKVQFDPRNVQCLCSSIHGVFTNDPISHAQFVMSSHCGQYIEVMREQANNTMMKPDYELWFEVRKIIDASKMNLIEAREWLDQKVLWTIKDIPKLT